MTSKDDFPEPLPREWLAGSRVPPADDEAYWDSRLQALMAATEEPLAQYRRPRERRVTWLEALGMRWRP
ncbi:MAG TPA: hypothetical protein VJ957_12150, partial [Longimicrobiales bacterium]|nr:hypothetical protein [Longimicrobiales bacterium]